MNCRYCDNRAIGYEKSYGETPFNVCEDCAHVGAMVHLFSGESVIIRRDATFAMHRLLGKDCAILLTNTTPRRAARREGTIVSVWQTRHKKDPYIVVLVMLHQGGTFESWEPSEIELIETKRPLNIIAI